MPKSKSGIISTNNDNTVILIDIPASIAAAQCLPGQANPRTLLSCTALEQPYPPTEPKSQKALAKVRNHSGDIELHELYASLAQSALECIEENNHGGDFCLLRTVAPWLVPQARKRKVHEVDEGDADIDAGDSFKGMLLGKKTMWVFM